MSKFRKQIAAGSIFLAAASLAAPASASVTVDFTFTSTLGQPGTITGKLVFLITGTGVAASEIYVLTAPAGTVSDATFGTNYLAGTPTVDTNSFTLAADGTVTAADLEVFNTGKSDFLNLNSSLNGHANLVSRPTGPGLYAYNFGGFAGATYTVETAAVGGVPEAATWTMMIVGLGVVGYAMRRRRTTAAYAL